jgi:hypothetical protein
MDKKLQSYLEDFKKYTIEMILNLKNDDIDNFEVALEKRGQILEEINHLNFNHAEFKKSCEELDIIDMENEINKIIKDKRDKLKEKILELKKSQNANKAYHLNMDKSNIFSKKV